jgi:hypothetical protein
VQANEVPTVVVVQDAFEISEQDFRK